MLHELLEAIALALDQAGIDYMLIGGQALERVCRKKIGRAEVRYASAEDLIIHKIFSGRPGTWKT